MLAKKGAKSNIEIFFSLPTNSLKANEQANACPWKWMPTTTQDVYVQAQHKARGEPPARSPRTTELTLVEIPHQWLTCLRCPVGSLLHSGPTDSFSGLGSLQEGDTGLHKGGCLCMTGTCPWRLPRYTHHWHPQIPSRSFPAKRRTQSAMVRKPG